MIEIIGFIVWFLLSVVLTVWPFLLIAVSGLGGGLGKYGFMYCACIWMLAAYSWYSLLSGITVSID
jgi:heme/copper-type cytochrome/quinol oxidase subunit 4